MKAPESPVGGFSFLPWSWSAAGRGHRHGTTGMPECVGAGRSCRERMAEAAPVHLCRALNERGRGAHIRSAARNVRGAVPNVPGGVLCVGCAVRLFGSLPGMFPVPFLTFRSSSGLLGLPFRAFAVVSRMPGSRPEYPEAGLEYPEGGWNVRNGLRMFRTGKARPPGFFFGIGIPPLAQVSQAGYIRVFKNQN